MLKTRREKIAAFAICCSTVGLFFIAGGSADGVIKAFASEEKKPVAGLVERPDGKFEKTIEIPPPPTAQAKKTFKDVALDYVNSAPEKHKQEAIEYLSLGYSLRNAQMRADTTLLVSKAMENEFKAEEWKQKLIDLKGNQMGRADTRVVTEMGGFKNANGNPAERSSSEEQVAKVRLENFVLRGVVRDLGGKGYMAFLEYEGKKYEVYSGYELFGQLIVEVFDNGVTLSSLKDKNKRAFRLYINR